MTEQREIATGISYSSQPVPEHARFAVEMALQKISGYSGIGNVFLFLTNGYARSPGAALKAAARASSSTQITGCCSAGILTDEEWLLDAEGAAAMIISGPPVLQPANLAADAATIFNLSCPPYARISIDQCTKPVIGAVTSDDYGQGPYSVWQSGRPANQGYILGGIDASIRTTIAIGQGVRQLSPMMEVTRSNAHVLDTTDGKPALEALRESIPSNLRDISTKQPHHILCAISETSSRDSIENGYFKLRHVVTTDKDKLNVGLTGVVPEKHHMFWAMRDEAAASQNFINALQGASQKLSGNPEFALVFPSISRGPGFYGGEDRDINLLREQFPEMPFIGFYSNGEIAPGSESPGLLHQYSTVAGLFAGA
jgi:small ligand-binding sensory domain FIST